MKRRLEMAIDFANEHNLGAGPRCLMLVMLVMMGDRTTLTAGAADIAAAYGSAERNVLRMLKIMRAVPGMLRVEASRSEGGARMPNRYSFPFLEGATTRVVSVPDVPPFVTDRVATATRTDETDEPWASGVDEL